MFGACKINATAHNVAMFTKLIPEIKRRTGMTDAQIADILGCNQSHVTRMKNGEVTDPVYSIGKAIVDMHQKALRRKK